MQITIIKDKLFLCRYMILEYMYYLMISIKNMEFYILIALDNNLNKNYLMEKG
jgi:hypothetical protein